LAQRLEKPERRYDSQFRVVFDAIRELMARCLTPASVLGFEQIPSEPTAFSTRAWRDRY